MKKQIMGAVVALAIGTAVVPSVATANSSAICDVKGKVYVTIDTPNTNPAYRDWTVMVGDVLHSSGRITFTGPGNIQTLVTTLPKSTGTTPINVTVTFPNSTVLDPEAGRSGLICGAVTPKDYGPPVVIPPVTETPIPVTPPNIVVPVTPVNPKTPTARHSSFKCLRNSKGQYVSWMSRPKNSVHFTYLKQEGKFYIVRVRESGKWRVTACLPKPKIPTVNIGGVTG